LWPLQHCPIVRVHLRGFASPATFRPQGFAPSRRFPPRSIYPALFHAGALMEFHTLQSFILVRSRNASRRPHALMPFTSTTHDRHGDPLVAAQPRKVAPAWGLVVWLQGLAPRNELVAIAVGFLGRLRARCSPGFPSPSGFALCDLAPWCFHPGSSHELLVVRAPYRYDRSHRTLRDRPGSPECSQDRE
jgi:hypothetical protein